MMSWMLVMSSRSASSWSTPRCGFGTFEAHLISRADGVVADLVASVRRARGAGRAARLDERADLLAQAGDHLVGAVEGDAGQAIQERAIAVLDGRGDLVDGRDHGPRAPACRRPAAR